ncbi:MAG TPA: type II toxin-antitoxin system PemK/MazF family toxin [Euzebya sp.]|nr:type II toxin-antitoxin system PemK/MazF family toxin [Euzebya sp.]
MGRSRLVTDEVMRGEVWWHESPDDKPRPVLVLSRAAAVPVMTKVLAAPLTTTVRRIPSEVALGVEDGVPKTCVVSLDNLAPVRKAHLTHRVTALGPDRLAEVCRAIAIAVDCD